MSTSLKEKEKKKQKILQSLFLFNFLIYSPFNSP